MQRAESVLNFGLRESVGYDIPAKSAVWHNSTKSATKVAFFWHEVTRIPARAREPSPVTVHAYDRKGDKE